MTFFKGEYEDPFLSEEISLSNGQSQKWEFTAAQQILSGQVEVKKGGIQCCIFQSSTKMAPQKPVVKTAPAPKAAPAPPGSAAPAAKKARVKPPASGKAMQPGNSQRSILPSQVSKKT